MYIESREVMKNRDSGDNQYQNPDKAKIAMTKTKFNSQKLEIYTTETRVIRKSNSAKYVTLDQMHRLGKCSLLFMKHPPRCSCHSPVRRSSCHSSVRRQKKLRVN